eukprot:755646-Hanusia_phi.AAC.8
MLRLPLPPFYRSNFLSPKTTLPYSFQQRVLGGPGPARAGPDNFSLSDGRAHPGARRSDRGSVTQEAPGPRPGPYADPRDRWCHFGFIIKSDDQGQ